MKGKERGSTAEGIIMKRNGIHAALPRIPGECLDRLRDSGPSLRGGNGREGERSVGMGSRQFDFHNGCVASQAAGGVVVFLRLRLRLRLHAALRYVFRENRTEALGIQSKKALCLNF